MIGKFLVTIGRKNNYQNFIQNRSIDLELHKPWAYMLKHFDNKYYRKNYLFMYSYRNLNEGVQYHFFGHSMVVRKKKTFFYDKVTKMIDEN